jgi:hypothetical protein
VSAHNDIVAAVKAQLLVVPAITPKVHRGRKRPIGADVAQAINVRFSGATPGAPGPMMGSPVDWVTVVIVECYARASAAQSGDEAALLLHTQAHDRLMSDPTLGGLADDVLPPTMQADDEELDETLGCLIAAYQVVHRTAARTL